MDTIGRFGIVQVEDNDMDIKTFDHHPQDRRVTPNDVAHIDAQAGTGGGNLPLVMETVASFMGGQGSKAGGIGYEENVSSTIKAAPSGGNQVPDIVVPINSMVIGKDIKEGDRQTTGIGKEGDPCPTLQTEHHHAVAQHLSVRRLLPVECERLMGFPDNWTQIPWRGKSAADCPDAPRYKACGNSMGVNCMRWIGLGIEAVEKAKATDKGENNVD